MYEQVMLLLKCLVLHKKKSSFLSHSDSLACFLQGAGAFEFAARKYLINEVKKTVKGVNVCLFSVFE
jgi:hypothetical protein